MKWRRVSFKNFIQLQRGFDLPKSFMKEGEIPVLGSNCIIGYHNEAKVPPPGVVTGRSGTLGLVQYTDSPYWPHNTALWVKDFKGNHPRFVFYKLQTLNLETFNGGVSVPTLNRNVLDDIEVSIPSHDEQKKIADILSTYDDLIEINRRRMRLLEESARQLYQEWFVRLRFPGHEHTRITDSVPEKWVKKVFGDICEDIRETASPDELEPETPYIGLEHIPRRSISLTEWGRAEEVTSTKHRFYAGEILFGKIRPYFHKVGIAFVNGVASSDAIVIRPKSEEMQGLTLMTVSSDPFIAQASQTMREGSKMPRADWKIMKQYPIKIPPQKILFLYNDIFSDIIEQLKILTFQNKKLQVARALLLPRLMSGEVMV
jgi:type I restriction enzyme, S subunit